MCRSMFITCSNQLTVKCNQRNFHEFIIIHFPGANELIVIYGQPDVFIYSRLITVPRSFKFCYYIPQTSMNFFTYTHCISFDVVYCSRAPASVHALHIVPHAQMLVFVFDYGEKKPYYRKKTPLVVSGIWIHALANSMAIAASALNHCATYTLDEKPNLWYK